MTPDSAREFLKDKWHKDRLNTSLINVVTSSDEERRRVGELLKIELEWWGEKEPYHSIEEIESASENGWLKRVESNKNAALIMRFLNPDLEGWQPYLSGPAHALLMEVGSMWRKRSRGAGVSDNISLAVTSLVRTSDYQKKIVSDGKLAAENSCHTKGESFDIDGCGYYENGEAINPRFTDDYSTRYNSRVHSALLEVLIAMKKEGKLNYIPEYMNTTNKCFHITRSPSYNQ